MTVLPNKKSCHLFPAALAAFSTVLICSTTPLDKVFLRTKGVKGDVPPSCKHVSNRKGAKDAKGLKGKKQLVSSLCGVDLYPYRFALRSQRLCGIFELSATRNAQWKNPFLTGAFVSCNNN